MQEIETNIIKKAVSVLSEDGLNGFAVRTKQYIGKKIKEREHTKEQYKDVLFISGCNEELPHPWRYRVQHQREQLEVYNISTEEVYFRDLKLQYSRLYRVFIFFRCPYTDIIDEFVETVKALNKTVLYDIDDLVIDTQYTNTIKYVQAMKNVEKSAYDEGVNSMGKLLRMCDAAITSTTCLANELKKYVSKVYINRNTASEEMVRLSERALVNKTNTKQEKVRIGYFSGSITHNADVQFLVPVLKKILDKYSNVELYLTGEIELPSDLKDNKNQIKIVPFMDWRKLPAIISSVDINLAPLEQTIFNEAKSENKWVEAALVKVVTVASDIGAFHECIENGRTGILCCTNEDWEKELEYLIENPAARQKIANDAYLYCKQYYTTIRTAKNIATIIDKLKTPNIMFALPGFEISGGVKVVLKHAEMLRNRGIDVTFLLLDGSLQWYKNDFTDFPVISIEEAEFLGRIDVAVATMWTTLKFVEEYKNIGKRAYLVQNYETDFYHEGNPLRLEANRTYRACNNVQYLTISKWCQEWLRDEYGERALYAPNGLEVENFKFRPRDMGGKIRVLIEGDCSVDYKNVDEAFEIVDLLDKEKYEIWYMSYNAEPKEKYRVDKFFNKVPYKDVPKIYTECDILLKTSLLESFSYPPLEMMATGGFVVAVPNGGNKEYLKDGENCLFYTAGNILEGRGKIERICSDEKLRKILEENGKKTARERAWSNLEKEIIQLYF